MERVNVTVNIIGNCLEIVPEGGVKDNSIYTVRIPAITAEGGKKVLRNAKFDFVTAIKPAYCTVDDIKMLVDVFDIQEVDIMRMIRRASEEADFIYSNSHTPPRFDPKVPIDENGKPPFEVGEFVKTKATLLALTRAYVVSGAESGLEGTLGKISFKNGDELASIRKLINDLRKEATKWQEAIRGYIFEGRNESSFALRGNKSLRATPMSVILEDYTRNGNMGYRGSAWRI